MEERNTDCKNLKNELTTQPFLADYNGSKNNIVTTDACNTGSGIALWKRQNNGEIKRNDFASRYLNDAEKKYWNHQAMEPSLKKNKTSKHYSARVTWWLERLDQFDITLKYTAGKAIQFTDFISRNPTENAEPEENYGK